MWQSLCGKWHVMMRVQPPLALCTSMIWYDVAGRMSEVMCSWNEFVQLKNEWMCNANKWMARQHCATWKNEWTNVQLEWMEVRFEQMNMAHHILLVMFLIKQVAIFIGCTGKPLYSKLVGCPRLVLLSAYCILRSNCSTSKFQIMNTGCTLKLLLLY